MKFPKSILVGLTGYKGDHSDEYSLVTDEHVNITRWSEIRRMVFSYKNAYGVTKHYSTEYTVGLTENQDERPFQYDEQWVECDEVKQVEKIITLWEKV